MENEFVPLPLTAEALFESIAKAHPEWRVRIEYATGVVSVEAIRHDEFAVGGLGGTNRFTTLTSVAGRQGFYCNGGFTFAANGSDYDLIQNLRVVNNLAKTGRNALLNFVNGKFRTVAGKIREEDAVAIDNELEEALFAALLAPGHVSAVNARCSRGDDIVSTRKLTGEFSVVPLGYARAIEFTAGFSRTSLAAAA